MKQIMLNPNLKVRKEYFGCILLDLSNKEINFYNKGAYDVFEKIKEPLPISDFLDLFHPDDKNHAYDFMNNMVEANKILMLESQTNPDTAIFYFQEEQNFTNTHFVSPLAVEIEPTLKCSRNCTYCCYESNPFFDMEGELAVGEWIKVLEQLKEDGIFSIKFTGGDPLMKKGLFEILKAADDFGFLITMGSDLTLLKLEDVEFFKNMKNLLMVQTTLDGSNPEIANFHRGKGNFKKVIKGIEMLSEREVPFSVVTVVTSENYHDIYNIGILLAKYNPLGYDIGMLFNSGRAKEMLASSFPTEEQIREATTSYSKLVGDGILYSINKAFTFNLEKLNVNQVSDYFLEQNCIQKSPESQLRIDPKGRCYVSISLKEKLQDDVYLGSLKELNIKNIWNTHPMLKKLRDLSVNENQFGKYFYINEI